MALTDVAIRNTKSVDRLTKLSDGGGLQLWITPQGSKLWRLAYRFSGKQKKLSLGAYPTISIREARERREEAKQLLRNGVDPSAHKRQARLIGAELSANTFDALADEYLAKLAREGRTENTVGKIRWILDFARPVFGARPIAEVSAPEVLVALRKVEARGRLETARRLRGTIGAVFRYGIATARADKDPTQALQGALAAPKVKPRAAIVEPKAFGALLRAIDGFDGQPTTHAALKLIALLFPRPGELRASEWSEFNLENAIWVIPADRMKMRRPHTVPLPKQAIAILKKLQPITGAGRLLLPSVRTLQRPISENTLNAALRRLGYAQDEVTAHGFRATASTLLNESGKWNPDAIERQLAHIESNDVRRAYARGEHWDERVLMMQWWADQLDRMRLPTDGVFA